MSSGDRWQEQRKAREHQATIAKHGLQPVTLLEVQTALVGWRHALEAADLAFAEQGDVQRPQSEIQEAALRRVTLEKLRHEEKSKLYERQRDIEFNTSLKRSSKAQVFLAAAVVIATSVQAFYAYEAFHKPDAPKCVIEKVEAK